MVQHRAAAAAVDGPPGPAVAGLEQAEAIELVGEGRGQPGRVQRQHEVLGAEVRHLVVLEQQLVAGAQVQDHVRTRLGHGGCDLGEVGHSGGVEAHAVHAGLEVGDDVLAIALAHDKDVGTRSAG